MFNQMAFMLYTAGRQRNLMFSMPIGLSVPLDVLLVTKRAVFKSFLPFYPKQVDGSKAAWFSLQQGLENLFFFIAG